MTKDEALKRAFDGLEALGKWYCLDEGPRTDEPWEVTALRKVCVAADKAMTEPDPKAYRPDPEPEQKPVAWAENDEVECPVCKDKGFPWPKCGHITYLERTPPQRTWVGLTDEEVLSEAKRFALGLAFPFNGITTPEMFARAIEAKLKQKNGFAEEKNK